MGDNSVNGFTWNGKTRIQMTVAVAAFLVASLTLAAVPAAKAQAPGPADVMDTATMERVGTMGFIDWPGARAAAVGHGAPPAGAYNAAQAHDMARQTALFVARSNLMEVLREIRVDSATRLGELLRAAPAAEERFRRMVDAAPIASERTLANGMVRLILVLPLTGAIARDIAAMATAPPSSSATAHTMTPPAATTATTPPAHQATTGTPPPTPPAPTPLAPAIQAVADNATGLIVDARGTTFTPTLHPRLVHDGTVIYPSPTVNHDTGSRQGYVRYFRDLAQAQQSDPAGTTPHTVIAKVRDGDLALSAEDAAFLQNILTKPGNFLDQCKVVVVF